MSQRFLGIVASAMVFGGAIRAQAAPITLANWDFAAGTYTPSTVDASVTVPDMTLNVGAGNAPIGIKANLGGVNWMSLKANQVSLGFNATGDLAVTHNNSVQFTVTPTVGNTIALTDFKFLVSRGGNGQVRGYVVQSSVDNFATATLLNMPTNVSLDAKGTDVVESETTSNYATVDLNLSSLANITNASPITFRVYSYVAATPAGSAGSAVDFKNIEVDGTIVPVPEPASVALLSLSGLAMLRRRRSH